MARLNIIKGPDAGATVQLEKQSLTIGRDPDGGMFLNDKGASRAHCEVYTVGELSFVKDLDSRNGTYVNNERIEEELLQNGDVIQIGSTLIRFESSEAARPEVRYESDRNYKSTLELRLDDLFVSPDTSRGGQYFRSIMQAAQLLQESDDISDAMDKLLDLIMETIPAESAYVFIRDEKTGAVTPRAWTEKSTEGGTPVSRTILKKVVAGGRSIMTSDAMSDERFNAGDSIIANKIKAVLCVPLTSHGDTFGAIYTVNQDDKETFEEEDLEILTGIGSLLSISLYGSRSVERKTDELVALIDVILKHAACSSSEAPLNQRVGRYAEAIAEELDLPQSEREACFLAGLFADIDALLCAGKDDPGGAWASFVADIRSLPETQLLGTALYYKRARFDGKNSPDGKAGNDIPLVARILTGADRLNDLLYLDGKPRMSIREAFEIFHQDNGALLDPLIIDMTTAAFRHGRLAGKKRGVAKKG